MKLSTPGQLGIELATGIGISYLFCDRLLVNSVYNLKDHTEKIRRCMLLLFHSLCFVLNPN